jgi:hypothetical protein
MDLFVARWWPVLVACELNYVILDLDYHIHMAAECCLNSVILLDQDLMFENVMHVLFQVIRVRACAKCLR